MKFKMYGIAVQILNLINSTLALTLEKHYVVSIFGEFSSITPLYITDAQVPCLY